MKKAYCRSCKYWSVNDNAIGLGMCRNPDMVLRLISIFHVHTTQNFGCVLHEEGKGNPMLEQEEGHKIFQEARDNYL